MGETEATGPSSLMDVFLKQTSLYILSLFTGDDHNGSSCVYSTNTNDPEVSHCGATSPSVRLRLLFILSPRDNLHQSVLIVDIYGPRGNSGVTVVIDLPLRCCLSRKDDGDADFSGGIGFMSSASIITTEQKNPSEMNPDVNFCEAGGEGARV